MTVPAITFDVETACESTSVASADRSTFALGRSVCKSLWKPDLSFVWNGQRDRHSCSTIHCQVRNPSPGSSTWTWLGGASARNRWRQPLECAVVVEQEPVKKVRPW